jgi:Cellulase (glycosyl hydrolase family 5)
MSCRYNYLSRMIVCDNMKQIPANPIAPSIKIAWVLTYVLVATLLSTHVVGATVAADPRNPPNVLGIEVTGAHGADEFDQVQRAGAGWTRIAAVWWPDVEPVQGNMNWDALKPIESQLLNADRNQLQVILVVRGTPAWAQQYPGIACGPIAKQYLASFADFVAALVARYRQAPYSVRYWELGNEPDIDRKLVKPDSLWGCWGDDTDPYYGGGAYAQMLKVVYPRIKQADPSAQVLIGGLVLDCDPRPLGGCPTEARRRPARFFEGILRALGGRYFDGISFHSYDYYDQVQGQYSNKNFNSTSGKNGPVSIAKAAYLRRLMRWYRVRNKYLISTESAVLCNQCKDDAGYEMTKAYYVAEVNAAALSAGLRANIWYRLTDDPGTALMTNKLQAKPAYNAYGTVASVLNGAVYLHRLTANDTGNAAVQGYAFLRAGRQVWVTWSADSQTQQMPMRLRPRRITNVYGQEISLPGSQFPVLRQPDQLLLYLEW